MDFKAKVDELQKQHGAIVSFVAGGQLFAFRAPMLDEFETYQEKLRNEKTPLGAARRELCNVCLVHPVEQSGSPSGLQAQFERKPLLATRIADQLIELCEADVEIVVKKD